MSDEIKIEIRKISCFPDCCALCNFWMPDGKGKYFCQNSEVLNQPGATDRIFWNSWCPRFELWQYYAPLRYSQDGVACERGGLVEARIVDALQAKLELAEWKLGTLRKLLKSKGNK